MATTYDENLPPLAPMPERQEISEEDLITFANVNGVNDARDQLMSGGMSAAEAGAMLARAGFAVGDLAQPEDISGGVAAPAAEEPEVRRAEPAMKPTGSVFGLGFIDQINGMPEAEARKMYDSLTPVQKRIYDRSFGYEEVTAAKAEQWSDEFFKEQAKEKPEDKANKPLGPREMQIALDDVAMMRNTIEAIKKHEGRSKALGYRGPMNIFAPSYVGGPVDKETGKQRPIPGSAAAGFSNLIESSRAKVFLPVIQRMRGFGSMQVREAEAAVNSANRLSLELSDKDFGSALEEVEDFADRFEARSRGVPVEEIKAARSNGQPQASPAADTRRRNTLLGVTYAVNPDGTLEKVAK
jgi:hypothetical protein